MVKRSSPTDATLVSQASDLEELVSDKRADWRATGTKARRHQRRYKNLLTQQLFRLGSQDVVSDDTDDD